MKSNLIYLALAYAVVWAVLFGYLFFVNRLQRRLEADVAVLRRSGEGQG